MLLRFPETFGVVSTFMRMFPAEFTPISPLDCASCMLRKVTVPWVGSARDQKSQPSKKLAPSLTSTNVQGEVAEGVGDPPEPVDVGLGVGFLALEEPEVMEETMTGFPAPDGIVDDDDGFCPLSPGLATQ